MSATEADQRFQIASGSVANALQMVLGFLVLALVTRFMPSDEIGTYFFLLSVVLVADGPLTGWVSGATKRYSEEGSAKSEMVGVVILGVLFYSSLFTLGAFVASEFTEHITYPFYLSVLFFGLLSSTSLLKLYTGTGRVGVKSWIEMFRTLLRAFGWIAVALLSLGVVGLIVSMTVASLLLVPIILFILFGGNVSLPSRKTLMSVGRFARYSSIGNIVYRVTNRMDVIIIGILIGSSSVASYEVVYKLTAPALLIVSVLSGSVLSRVSELHSKGEDLCQEIENSVSFGSFLSIPILFGSLAMGEVLVTTAFGSEYQSLGAVIVAMASYRVIESQVSLLGSFIAGIDRPDLQLYVSVSGAMLNIVFSIVGAITFGIVGVISGSIVSALFKGVIFGSVVKRETGRLPLTRSIFFQLVSGLLMFGTLVFLTETLGLSGWGSVILFVGIGGTVYISSVLVLDQRVRQTIPDKYVHHVV